MLKINKIVLDKIKKKQFARVIIIIFLLLKLLIMKKFKFFIAGFAFFAVLSLPNYGFCSKGTLMGNDLGTSYCCCPGSNGCGAIECPTSVCGNPIE